LAGILRYGSYVPYFRLQRSALGGGRGERAVASYDEDALSMGVEAAREVVRRSADVDAVLFATTTPPYAEKLGAATLAVVLGLPAETRTLDVTDSTRMGVGALLLGDDLARAGGKPLVVISDLVLGAPTGARERDGGDAAVAFQFGPERDAIARVIGRASATTEVLDSWRLPEERFAHQWEERFGAEVLAPVALDVARRAVKAADIEAKELSRAVLDSTNLRALGSLPRALGIPPERVVEPLAASVGRSGAAHAGLLLAQALDDAKPGERILVLCAADGCDAFVVEVTDRIAAGRPARSVQRWIDAKRNDLPYFNYLKWRGIVPFEPPRRPDPERPAAPPMRRSERWKLGFYGSRCTACGTGHLPPQRVCVKCGATDRMKEEPFADVPCRVATYTLDHLAYSLQPPVVVAVADYTGGGRFNCELTDVDPASVAIGNELEMTFRRLFTAQGVHNYFWKARVKR
jgi:3-hydroxy-3-methylglutaryl CoA synthase